MPLWHRDCFKLKTYENQPTQAEAFSDSLSAQNRASKKRTHLSLIPWPAVSSNRKDWLLLSQERKWKVNNTPRQTLSQITQPDRHCHKLSCLPSIFLSACLSFLKIICSVSRLPPPTFPIKIVYKLLDLTSLEYSLLSVMPVQVKWNKFLLPFLLLIYLLSV